MAPLEPQATLRRYAGSHAAHLHDHAQLLFGVTGRLTLEVDGRTQRVEPGVGLVVPAGAAHAYEAQGPVQVWVVDAPDEPAWQHLRRFALPPAWCPDADVGAHLAWAGRAPRLRVPRSVDPVRLTRAVDGRLHQAWPTGRMATLYALSVPQFHARWLALTGLAPQAWLRRQRLDLAERLLRRGQTLAMAATATGYASAGVLTLALRRDRDVGVRRLRLAAALPPGRVASP